MSKDFKSIWIKLIYLGLIFFPWEAFADDYNHVATDIFWNKLYAGGGWSLYCGYRFEQAGNAPAGFSIGIDHVYDTEWMLDHLNCNTREQCYIEQQDIFVRMESDLHNLYPAWTDLTVYRYERQFGEVNGEEWRFESCDFEWKSGIVEPRPLSRGNIARAIFYMYTKYKLPVSPDILVTLKKWHSQDPPSEQELIRNDRIEQIQGARNPYIDDPELAESLVIPGK
jgi:deoxyribonuclease-1